MDVEYNDQQDAEEASGDEEVPGDSDVDSDDTDEEENENYLLERRVVEIRKEVTKFTH